MSMPEKTQAYFQERIGTILQIAVMNNHDLEEIDKALDMMQLEMSVVLVDPAVERNYKEMIHNARDAEEVENLVNKWYVTHIYDERATKRIDMEAELKMKKEGWKN